MSRKTMYLTEAEKRTGRKNNYISEIFNGISFPLLADTIVYLLAAELGAGSFALGFISSSIYVAGIILPFAPFMLRGRNLIKVQSLMWFLRGIFSLGYLLLFLVTGKPAVMLLLFTYFMFCLCKMIGMSLNDFTIKNISSRHNSGKVVGNINLFYQGSSIITKSLTTLYLSVERLAHITGMVFLQVLGVIANSFGAFFISRIPCRSTVTYKKGRGIMVMFREAMENPMQRRRLKIKWSFTLLLVAQSLIVPFLRVELGLSSSEVFLFSILCSAAIMLSGALCKSITDKIGSKPIVIYSTIFLSIAWIAIMLIPASAGAAVFFILGFAINFFTGIGNIQGIRLVTAVIPDGEALSFNSMSNFVLALLAILAGFLNGLFVDAGTAVIGASELFNSYSFVFLSALAISFFILFTAFRLQEDGAFQPKQAAKVLFSIEGISTLSTIGKLDRESDPLKRKSLLMNLGINHSNLAVSEMRMILALPFSRDKIEVIQSLGDRPQKELIPDLIAIARDDDSFAQLEAITALGNYGNDSRVVDTLRSLLSARWSSVRAIACRSLAKILQHDDDLLKKIDVMSDSSKHIHEAVDYLVAKKYLDKQGVFYRSFFRAVELGRSQTFRQTRYAVIASFLKFGSQRLAVLFGYMNNGDVDDFLSEFLTEARDVEEINYNYDAIMKAFSTGDLIYIRDICMKMLHASDVSHNVQFENLRQGLLTAERIDIDMFDTVDALAMLYFSYSLRKNSD